MSCLATRWREASMSENRESSLLDGATTAWSKQRTEKKRKESIDEQGGGEATTIFPSLKGTSIISKVGTYLAFLSHPDALISPRPASRMSQQMLSAAFQTTRKTSYYTPVCLLINPPSSLPVSIRCTIQHQNTNAVQLYCINCIYCSVARIRVEGIRLLFWNRVVLHLRHRVWI